MPINTEDRMADSDRKNFAEERLLTISEVALYARVKERTVVLWIERGILPVLRPAGTRVTRIRASDLEQMLSRDRRCEGIAV